jgi:cyclopropane fatty-acyl-phospholipid synthase-like methyltransferase
VSKNTRSIVTVEKKEEQAKILKDTDAQFKYWETTKNVFKEFLSVLQRCTELKMTKEQVNELQFPIDDYKLTENSTFLDIGSGLPKTPNVT